MFSVSPLVTYLPIFTVNNKLEIFIYMTNIVCDVRYFSECQFGVVVTNLDFCTRVVDIRVDLNAPLYGFVCQACNLRHNDVWLKCDYP